MIDLKTCRRLSNNGALNLPAKWRKKLGLEIEDVVEIKLNTEGIIIQRSVENNFENTRYISSKGTITIPVELRNFLRVDKNTEYCLYVNEEDQQFIVVPQKE